MRLGIRAKLVSTLLLAGMLPLAMTLAVVLFEGVGLRIQSKGQMYRALAAQQAQHLVSVLEAQADLANSVNNLPGMAGLLEQANTVPPLTAAQIGGMEAAWPTLSSRDKGLAQILGNDLSEHWKSVRKNHPRFSEVMITDRSGRLIAATGKTSDYFQADEDWWKACYAEGKGRPLISRLGRDESAVSPQGKQGTMVVDLCLPIYDRPEKPADERKLLGIAKMSIDASWVIHQLQTTGHADELPHAAWLVNTLGESMMGDVAPAPVNRLPPESAAKVRAGVSGWVMDDEMAGYEMVAIAPVEQGRLKAAGSQRWFVVVATDRMSVLQPVYRMAWQLGLIGVAVIVACFFGGLMIARREIIRPMVELGQAVDQVKAGNRGYRLSEARGGRATFREDEIGQLARDFNLMARHLEHQLRRMEESDELKRQFIDLASHELRTPVTYILGAAQLAQRQDGHLDPALLERIASKAQRLNHIIENMFKLLASDRFDALGRESTEIDLRALIEKVHREHEPFLRERKQTYSVSVGSDTASVHADEDLLRDILSNLLSNAIRFSADGGSVGIRTSRVATHRGQAVEIAVWDSGPGIPADDVPHLFKPFFTGADVAHHSSGEYQFMSRGMGLGLSVVKRFVELQGGGVLVDTSSKGTTIRVRLPIEAAASTDGPVKSLTAGSEPAATGVGGNGHA